jgi:HPt (histidine-containing phosphotransfer) domain-containing protein
MTATIAPSSRHATDDEILNLASVQRKNSNARTPEQLALDFDAADVREPAAAAAADADSTHPAARANSRAPEERSATQSARRQDRENSAPSASSAQNGEPEELRAAFDANPELRRAWHDAHAYRETFATPEEARNATALLADLDRMDALFFSRRPEDHAELARAVAALDPAAFASLAHAMSGLASSVGAQSAAADARAGAASGQGTTNASSAQAAVRPRAVILSEAKNLSSPSDDRTTSSPTAAQTEFFHATNAAAVEGVIGAIESQVERLLPEGVSRSARSRVVGEIYRELDNTLRANRQLSQQMRDAFRSGALDAEHQRAIVSLVTARARQALPGVAKRVMNEWTSTLVAANQERRARQRTAERRVDIAGSSGSGSDAHRSMMPREIDYARMSDSDILNM